MPLLDVNQLLQETFELTLLLGLIEGRVDVQFSILGKVL